MVDSDLKFRGIRSVGRRRLRAAGFAGAILFLSPFPLRAELAPIAQIMIESMSAIDEIGLGLATSDFKRIERAATVLREGASRLEAENATTLGLRAKRTPAFGAFASLQRTTAESILAGAVARDSNSVLLGVQHLMGGACIACHRGFRDRQNLLRPPVALMTSLLTYWRSINRGLLLNDFSLVEESAHEINVLLGVFTHDVVIEATFGIKDPEIQKNFRSLLNVTRRHARQIQRAADSEDLAAISDSLRMMWSEGCLSCHTRFR